jgi:hypothetical protein
MFGRHAPRNSAVASFRPRRALPTILRRAPPSGSDWIHEIKHDGYRLMARRDSPAWAKRHGIGDECTHGCAHSRGAFTAAA